MWRFSVFCLLFFFILTPQAKPSTIITATTYDDRIDQTCSTCAEMSKAFSHNMCLTSLQAVPASHVTNLQGLALIAMELAIQNATASLSTIKKLLSSGSFDPFALSCLIDCLGLYSGGVVTLMGATGAFLAGNYDEANAWVSSVMDATTTCEDGFIEKEGEISPLENENYYLFQLCDIVICIINLLSLSECS